MAISKRFIQPMAEKVLPCIPVRGSVAFPNITINFELTRDICKKAYEAANNADGYVFIVTQENVSAERPKAADLYRIGTVAKIKQTAKSADGSVRVLFEGKYRALCNHYIEARQMIRAELIAREAIPDGSISRSDGALCRSLYDSVQEISKYTAKLSPQILLVIASTESLPLLTDFIAANILVKNEDKQLVLSEFDPTDRAKLLLRLLETEIDILKTEQKIRAKVKESMDKNQRDYYLREQLKAIEEELDEEDEEIEEYTAKLEASAMPDDCKEKISKDIRKLAKSPYTSAESSVLRNYLDAVFDIPWGRYSKDRTDIEHARKILDRDHSGLERVKKRILEFLAVKQLNPEAKSPIICLVGPPGVGKTSIASSVAEATGRKFVRASLGGIRDEADIRGHRKTYIGSMPGRIITAITTAGTMNPLILLDEIDKMSSDIHGDPASAMLEVLDGEQNVSFRDHFIEMPVDLSRCMFICTANTLDTVPRPLLDRMDVIELDTYTKNEKFEIARRHLIPKQRKRHGLKASQFAIDDEALYEIIDSYTREAGVRNLERTIGSLMRKAAVELASGSTKKVVIKKKDLETYLQGHKMPPEKIDEEDQIGCVNGLAYTSVGGDLLKVEAAVTEGTGKLDLTGSLGDVMKESAHAAITYIRTVADRLNIDPQFYKNKDIHIHVPEGATPKDGPSAGVTMMTAVASALSGTPVRRDTAMTGEITLRGKVLPIGGLKEKTMAAYTAGVKRVLIPTDNVSDLSEIDPLVRGSLEFIPCSTADDVLEAAFVHGGRSDVAYTVISRSGDRPGIRA
ncbi:MAG: endopeptidase La [Clostridia bacterium]|nr:endopeptidase La [Clostridia bacterium]